MRRWVAAALVVLGATAAFGQETNFWKGVYDGCRKSLEAYQGSTVAIQRASAFVLVIDAPDELVTAVAATEEAALRELRKYVRRNWKAPVPIPTDEDDAVDQFFSSPDYDYEIREQPLAQ